MDNNQSSDFVWRFKIDEKPYVPVQDDPLTELIRVQWEELLKLSVPVYNGVEVKVDGFKLMKNLSKVIPVYEDIQQHQQSAAAGKATALQKVPASADDSV